MYNIRMRIAIYGGAFDPPHNGHVSVVQSAIETLQTEKLLVMPTGRSPYKTHGASFEDRVSLSEAAFCPFGAEVSREEGTDEQSYTYLTLQRWKEKYPNDELFFILGADSLRDFHTWRNPKRVVQLCTLAVYPRPGVDLARVVERQKRRFGTEIAILSGECLDVSSTAVRWKAQFGLPLEEVPPAVAQEILARGLYREYRSMTQKLQSALTPERYLHTYRVVLKALELNRQLHLNEEQVVTGCILHDCAKYLPEEVAVRYGVEKYPRAVRHAFLGAYVAKEEYGIRDEAVLSAIRYHTTGKPKMSKLEQLVYVADSIEDGRKGAALPKIRKTAARNFERGFLQCLQNNYRYAKRSQEYLCPLTEECMEFYTGERK